MGPDERAALGTALEGVLTELVDERSYDVGVSRSRPRELTDGGKR